MSVPAAHFDRTSGLMLFALATIWGGSFFFAEIALTEMPALTVALHRVFWAVPVLALILACRGVALPKAPQAWLCFLVMGALNNALPFSLIFWGQTTVESGLAAILNSTTAFFGVVVAGALLPDEKLSASRLLGTMIGFLGVAVIMGLDALLAFDQRNLAQLAILAAALSYSFAGVWGRRFLSSYSPLVNTLGMLIGSAVLLWPAVLLTHGVPEFALSGGVWVSIAMLSVVCTAFAYLLYFSVLARAGSANLMLVTLLILPFALALGAGFLGETFSPNALIGFGLIALGLVVTDGRVLKKVTG